MLLQKCEWEPVEPRKILPCGLVPRSRFDLAIGHIEDPVTAVLNPPMTADRACKCLQPQRQTADEVAHLLGVSEVDPVFWTTGRPCLDGLRGQFQRVVWKASRGSRLPRDWWGRSRMPPGTQRPFRIPQVLLLT